MPVAQPITGVKLPFSEVVEMPEVHNKQQGLLGVLVVHASAFGNPQAYTRSGQTDNLSFAWVITDTYSHPTGDASLAFGTKQMIRVPSIWSL